MSHANAIARAYCDEATRQLTNELRKIEHCLAQLDEFQLWWRPTPQQNSIANLLLHLEGNLRQWMVAGVGEAPDVRDRPAEFADRSGRSQEELLALVRGVVEESTAVLSRLSDGDILAPRRVQGFELSVLSVVFDTTAHFRGHVQEIISLTRQQLGGAYRFDFVPATPEEGA